MINISTISRILVTVLLSLTCFTSIGQEDQFWQKIEHPTLAKSNTISYGAKFKNFDSYILDKEGLKSTIQHAPFRFSQYKSNVEVDFPNKKGELESFTIYQTEIMSPSLAAKFPNIKTYMGVSKGDKSKTLNLTLTNQGVYVMLNSSGNSTFINPASYHGDVYMVFSKNQAYTDHLNQVFCEVEEDLQDSEFDWSSNAYTTNLVNNSTLRRYRLALACTSQYANFHLAQAGIPSTAPIQDRLDAVQAAMVVTINRVNSIYERDLAINLQFIDNNDDLIQLNSVTDPYTNNNGQTMLGENQTQVDNVIGTSNYDIGHVFSTGGGGIAALGSVCNPNIKAAGVTGLPNPVGDPFDVDFVSHEMGHQFNATHTFNNFCGGARSPGTAMEPGSGNTIMGYAGICTPNVQNSSNDNFHIISVAQINNFTSSGNGSVCSEDISLSNTPPSIDTPLQDYIVPISTPFVLDVDASDLDNDVLTYTWEQLDNETGFTQPPLPTNTGGPNFKSLSPSVNSFRYFPELPQVVSGQTPTPNWEVLPSVSRDMEFAVLVRDNNDEGGQSAFQTTDITFVDSSGPFTVTSQNSAGIIWEEGETETVTWDVANTDAAPINAAEVDILLSTNGGFSFPTVLAANVPNNGSADVVVPNIFGASCRVMVKASDNIFFNVNSQNFSIDSDAELECTEPINTTTVQIPDGVGQNQQGPIVNSTITFNDPIIIESITTSVDITHSYIQDLVFALVGPDEQTVTLFQRDCDNEGGISVLFDDNAAPIPDNCTDPFTGTYQPSNGNLNQWVGTNAQGEWNLLLADFWDGDVGQLNSWSIEICTSSLSTVNLEANQFSIVPNPNNGRFQVNFSGLSGAELSGKLYNVQGKLIEDVRLEPGLLNQEVQFENLQQGMYLFQINDGQETYVEKLLIR